MIHKIHFTDYWLHNPSRCGIWSRREGSAWNGREKFRRIFVNIEFEWFSWIFNKLGFNLQHEFGIEINARDLLRGDDIDHRIRSLEAKLWQVNWKFRSLWEFWNFQESFDLICKSFRQKLKEGLVRDVERQQVQQEMKKTMNTYNLQQQKELEKILRREEKANLAIETWDCNF